MSEEATGDLGVQLNNVTLIGANATLVIMSNIQVLQQRRIQEPNHSGEGEAPKLYSSWKTALLVYINGIITVEIIDIQIYGGNKPENTVYCYSLLFSVKADFVLFSIF